MKKLNLFYWIVTGLFGAFMLFSAIPNILVMPESVTFMTHLGYPVYFIAFIGVAKLLGVVGILVPGFPTIKEWAYAGLFYDLVGATYSNIAADGFAPGIYFMLLPFSFIALSYVLYHKRLARNLVPRT